MTETTPQARLAAAISQHGQEARYEVIALTYLDDKLLIPGEVDPDDYIEPPKPRIISHTGAPNPAMRPVNDAAKKIFAAWRKAVTIPLISL